MVDEVTAALDGLTRREHLTGPNDLVFPNEVGQHLCGWTVRRRYYAALDAAGLPRLRFHDLRHCFATIAVQRLPLHTVQGNLGHAHISTTMRYVHHTARGPRRGAGFGRHPGGDGADLGTRSGPPIPCTTRKTAL